MQEKYSEYVPHLWSKVDCILHLCLKALLTRNECNLYRLYIRRQRSMSNLTHSVIESFAAARNCTTEKRTAAAIMYSTYIRKDIDDVVEQVKLLVAEVRTEEGNDGAKADATEKQSRSTSNGVRKRDCDVDINTGYIGDSTGSQRRTGSTARSASINCTTTQNRTWEEP